MQEISLTQGKIALVDDEDFRHLSQWQWFAVHRNRSFHAARNVWREGQRTTLYMHQLLVNVPLGMMTDHIDGNGLNNQRANLRACTPSQNTANTAKYSMLTSSQYRGVYWRGDIRKWHAQVRRDGKYFHLGHFRHEREAALAYNEAALEHFGGFAMLNV